MPAIEVRGLTKRYGPTEALRGIDLAVEEGEVVALLGPNGAGKTTTMEILEGHRLRSSGDALVLGFDPAHGGREFRERIGVVLQSSGMDRELTVRESVELYSAMYPVRYPTDRVIEIVGLEGKAGSRVKTLSGGQQRRLDLALGIVGRPEVILLDEPTTGFDPAARRKSWGLIDSLRSLGTTILLTTHYMDEAQHLADRVAVLVDGLIVAEGSPDMLADQFGTQVVVSFRLPPDAPRDLPEPFASQGPAVRATISDPTRDLHRLTAWAVERDVDLQGLAVTRPSLEDVYLQLTGGEEGDG